MGDAGKAGERSPVVKLILIQKEGERWGREIA
jgi:hypothetical protein